MFKMEYRTRIGTTNFSGKAKLFLTCHREDQERYLEETIKELLEYGNYVIWFHEYNFGKDEYDYEMVREYIEDAQLLVVLVTNQLLKDSGGIAEYEVLTAREYHIPILPIAIEVIDDQLFAKMFGSVHYLSPHVMDETGIPYSEKLKTHLGNILIGEQQREKIRTAFRKKVFLSYRKKDRRTAEMLMKKIHSSPSCYDIGIWYDEFLNPGRDFNNEIKQEIETCDVFALNVTPSLLEDGNYIKKEEFPCALENKKNILPVEMIPTNQVSLQKEYPELPSCVRGEDESAAQSISQILGTDTAMVQDAEKMFYLGLAYLDGVYTDKNTEMAVRLIVSAAEQGLAEATEKLCLMYREGQGVKRDIEESLKWKKILVQQLEEQLLTGHAVQTTMDKYFDSCLSLGQDLQKEGRNTEAEVYYRKMLALSQSKELNDFWEIYQRSVCIMALADIEVEKRHFDQAIDMYVNTIKLRLELLDKIGDDKKYIPLIRRALAVAYLKLGDCERIKGYYKSVLDAYEQCLMLRTAAVQELTSGDKAEYEARRDLAVIQVRLGEMYEEIADRGGDQKYVSEAYYFYRESLKLRMELEEELRTDDATRDLGVVLCRLARLELKCGMMAEAGGHLEKGLEIRQKLAENSGFLQDRRNLASAYMLQADYHLANQDQGIDFGGWISQIEIYQKACELMTYVGERTGNISDRRVLAEIHTRIGELHEAVGQEKFATIHLYRSVELYHGIQEDSAEEIDKGDYRSVEESALALYKLGMAGKTSMHREMLLTSYNLWKGLADLAPDNEVYRQNAENIAKIDDFR